jgi:hypothetical protein
MSPTSYQAAPPRMFTIADMRGRVKSACFNTAAISYDLISFSLLVRLPSSLPPPPSYHVLYAVPSKGDVKAECEWTSTIPVVT